MPDFDVSETTEALIECVSVMPPDLEARADARNALAVDLLLDIESSEWSVSYMAQEVGPQPVRQKQLKAFVENWIQSLDRERALSEYADGMGLPDDRWTDRGWIVDLEAYPLAGSAPLGDVQGGYSSQVVAWDGKT